MSLSRNRMLAWLGIAVLTFTLSNNVQAQTIPFLVLGSGVTDDLPLAVGVPAEHRATGWATKVGQHESVGMIQLVSPPDFGTLTADFESAQPVRFVSSANPNNVLACNYGVTSGPLPAASPGKATFVSVDAGTDPNTPLDDTFIIVFLAEFRPALEECSGRFAPTRLKSGSFTMLAVTKEVKLDPVNGVAVSADPDSEIEFSWVGAGSLSFKWPYAFF